MDDQSILIATIYLRPRYENFHSGNPQQADHLQGAVMGVDLDIGFFSHSPLLGMFVGYRKAKQSANTATVIGLGINFQVVSATLILFTM